jgi:hypothetical protein
MIYPLLEHLVDSRVPLSAEAFAAPETNLDNHRTAGRGFQAGLNGDVAAAPSNQLNFLRPVLQTVEGGLMGDRNIELKVEARRALCNILLPGRNLCPRLYDRLIHRALQSRSVCRTRSGRRKSGDPNNAVLISRRDKSQAVTQLQKLSTKGRDSRVTLSIYELRRPLIGNALAAGNFQQVRPNPSVSGLVIRTFENVACKISRNQALLAAGRYGRPRTYSARERQKLGANPCAKPTELLPIDPPL